VCIIAADQTWPMGLAMLRDGIIVPQPVELLLLHHAVPGLVGLATPIEMMDTQLDAVSSTHRVKHSFGGSHHFASDSTAGQYGNFT
jgi:hypothetical protein